MTTVWPSSTVMVVLARRRVTTGRAVKLFSGPVLDDVGDLGFEVEDDAAAGADMGGHLQGHAALDRFQTVVRIGRVAAQKRKVLLLADEDLGLLAVHGDDSRVGKDLALLVLDDGAEHEVDVDAGFGGLVVGDGADQVLGADPEAAVLVLPVQAELLGAGLAEFEDDGLDGDLALRDVDQVDGVEHALARGFGAGHGDDAGDFVVRDALGQVGGHQGLDLLGRDVLKFDAVELGQPLEQGRPGLGNAEDVVIVHADELVVARSAQPLQTLLQRQVFGGHRDDALDGVVRDDGGAGLGGDVLKDLAQFGLDPQVGNEFGLGA